MGNIIHFRTREEWEEEKKAKTIAEWEAYLAWEEETLRRKAAEENQKHNTESKKETYV